MIKCNDCELPASYWHLRVDVNKRGGNLNEPGSTPIPLCFLHAGEVRANLGEGSLRFMDDPGFEDLRKDYGDAKEG